MQREKLNLTLANRGILSPFFLIFCLISILLLPVSALAAPQEDLRLSKKELRKQKHEKLKRHVKRKGRARIIVELNVEEAPAQVLRSRSARYERQEKIKKSRERALRRIDRQRKKAIKAFKNVPYMSMEIDELSLEEVIADPDVKAVYIDQLKSPKLQQSVPLIGATESCDDGYCGQGQTIAILDTGVDDSHSFLSGKVVHQACFSTTDSFFSTTTVCPNGQETQIGGNAGIECSIDGCDHGTHVAGIAAGNGTNAGQSFSGVAPEANLMSVQVFSRFEGIECTNAGYASPCVLAYTSDVIAGLEHVYSQRNNFTISSVNLSLGSGAYSSVCDSEPEKAAIDLLNSAGIAVVAASGNEGLSSSMIAPACISSAISVGSTIISDSVSSFSNSASFLDLLAPGSFIYSSIPGNSYGYKSGTSMATPHVAGAFAVYRSFNSSASINTMLNDFKASGVAILDDRNGLTFPRITLDVILDSDDDGVRNFYDTDDDNDGVLDIDDAFPFDPTESIDTDGDGTGNNADADDDNDGVLDVDDAFPLDPTEWVDTDGDGTGNNADADDDNDGVLDAKDAFPLDPTESIDTDRDGTGNNADTDDDNDGVLDDADNCPFDYDTANINTDGDALCDGRDIDDDNDGLPDVYENLHAFLDPLIFADAQLDEDGDSHNNLSEYHALTDPNDASDNPTLSAFYKSIAIDGANVGNSVSIDGDIAIVGAFRDNGDIGAAYIYQHDGAGNWIQQAKLTADDGEVRDFFGRSVSLSGDTAIVGADGNGDDDRGYEAGAAYIFQHDGAGNWSQQAKLVAFGETGNKHFGNSVSLYDDTALVGAKSDRERGYFSGAAYVFQRDASGNWTQEAKLKASDADSYSSFGNSVSLSTDTALIGAHLDDANGNDSGAVYIFQHDGAGNWTEQAKLTATDGAKLFGTSVSLYSQTALISGGNSAYIFQPDGSGNWSQQAKLSAAGSIGFGSSVSLSGNTALVGAASDGDNGFQSGGAYIFVHDGSGNWNPLPYNLKPADGAAHDRFGSSVSISGQTVLIGATGDNPGSVYFISLDSDGDGDGVTYFNDNCPKVTNASQIDTDKDGQGDACDFDDDNDGYSDIDENDNGSSPTNSNDTPADFDGDLISDLNDTDDDNDGILDVDDNCPFDVDTTNINTDGDALCSGKDPDDDSDGLPDVYERLHAFLDPSNAADAQLDEDGDGYDNLSEYHAVTDPSNADEDPSASAFYKIIAADGSEHEWFGYSVSVDGDTALVGARQDDDNGNDSGSAYVFQRDGSGNWVQQAKLTAADGAENDWFGYSVSVDGDTALVGAVQDDDVASASGSVYVFHRDGADNWVQQAKLTASDAGVSHLFGYSVSIIGDSALVGAYNSGNTGAVYVFHRDISGSWSQQARLIAADGVAHDQFGKSVSLFGDTALVGADYDDEKGDNSGSAYIFKHDGAGNWVQQAKLTASDGAADDFFGRSVSLSGDTALVGSYWDDDDGDKSGSAYIFKDDGTGNWVQQVKLTAADGVGGRLFGYSVSLSGGNALVGSNDHSVYLFSRDGAGDWVQRAKLTTADWERNDNFARSVSIDGNTTLIGAYRDDENNSASGSAYFISLAGDADSDGLNNFEDNCSAIANANQLDTDGDTQGDACDTDDDDDGYSDSDENANGSSPIDAGDTPPDYDGDFISNVNDSDDDNDGIIDVIDNCPFDVDATNLNTDGDALCDTDDADDDGDGLPDVYENLYSFLDPINAADAQFDEDGDGYDNLSEYHAVTDPNNAAEDASISAIYKVIVDDGAASDQFAISVSVDGDTALVGAYQDDDKGNNSGSAYIFQRDGSGKWLQQAKLIAADGEANDRFGLNVSLSGDTALVGAYWDDDNGNDAGAAYIFQHDGAGNWNQQAKLTAVDGVANDWFGGGVSIFGDTALVGADRNNGRLGSVYVFQDDGAGNWSQQAKLTAADGQAFDHFGVNVSLFANTALVGASGDDDKAGESGAAYIFQHDGAGNWVQHAKLTAADGATLDRFGSSVSLSDDIALIGSHHAVGSGAAYVFQHDGAGNWEQQAKLTASDGASSDEFGRSVSIDGDTALVGSYRDDDKGSDSGSAYVFQRDGAGNWLQQAKITVADGAANDWFGFRVSLSGDTVLAGAALDDDNDGSSGSAYFIALDSDGDGDSVVFLSDNCPTITNVNQADTDGDDQGDVCDTDDDNDGYSDSDENDNGTSTTDSSDTPPDNDGDFISDLNDPDDDNDGFLDSIDNCPFDADAANINTDGDVLCDTKDKDDDEDGYSDIDEISNSTSTIDAGETPPDNDGDFTSDRNDGDDDNDGLPDVYENQHSFLDPFNVADAQLDEDGDGHNNLSEYHALSDPNDSTNDPTTSAIYKIIASDGAADDQFASRVSIDGDTALIGTYRNDNNGSSSDSVYIYQRDAAGRWLQHQKLVAADGESGDLFGRSVSLSGGTALVGAREDDDSGSNSGSVYVFLKDGAGNWVQQAKLTADDAFSADAFGNRVSLLNDTALIGAIWDDDNGTNSGSAYIFQRDDAGNWRQEAKLLASDGAAFDYFGADVSLSGDTALVGAYDDDDNGTNSGSAYIFQRDSMGNWNQQAKLVAMDGETEDNFGGGVSLSDNTALIAAIRDDDNDTNSGSAYIFQRDGAGNWNQQAKLVATDGQALDYFGSSVSLFDDIALIGAIWDDDNGTNSGAAYLFYRNGESWIQDTKLTAADGVANDIFGRSVSLSTDVALIGAPGDNDKGGDSGSAYFFSLDLDGDGIYFADAFPNDPTESVDTDNDGVGNNADTDDDNDGMLDVFESANGLDPLDSTGVNGASGDLDGDSFTNLEEFNAGTNPNDVNDYPAILAVQKIVGSDIGITDLFGSSVSIDGDMALVGAYQKKVGSSFTGAAYIFARDVSGNWIEQAQLTANDGAESDNFGYSVSLDGDIALIGARYDNNGAGSVYVFTRDGSGNWSQQAKLTASDGAANDEFGHSVSLNNGVALIGSVFDDDSFVNSGSVYVFIHDGSGNWSEKTKLNPDDVEANKRFGWSVSLAANMALIGAFNSDGNTIDSGAAYIFVRDSSGNWSQQTKLTASDGVTSDRFGWGVSLDGNMALIGVPDDDDVGSGSGSVYMFTLDSLGNWNEQQKLIASDGAEGDKFGYRVDVKGDVALVSGHLNDDNGSDSGSVYVFTRDGSGNWNESKKLVPSDGASSDQFGWGISFDDDVVLVGAWSDDHNGINSGSAYFYSFRDIDNDGIRDDTGIDNCPVNYNPGQLDADNDGIGDVCDDSDNDGVPDNVDAFPNNPTESLDTDNDGLGNNADTDDDNDGMPDTFETSNGLDPLINDANSDLDGDGYTNLEEYYAYTNPNDPTDFPLIVESDYDGDGDADILLRHNTTGQWRLFIMDVGMVTDVVAPTLYNNTAWDYVASKDYDGDGDADILLRHNTTGQWRLFIMDVGMVTDVVAPTLYNNTAWDYVASKDYDGDGDADILLRHNTTGQWRLFIMDVGMVTDVVAPTLYINTAWDYVASKDYDGDGDADILLRHNTTGQWRLFIMDVGMVTDVVAPTLYINTAWDYVASKDYDGDGDADILLRHNTTGQWRLFIMDVGMVTDVVAPTLYINTAWDYVASKDYDGDGDADILLRHNTTGQWRLFIMDVGMVTDVVAPTLYINTAWDYVASKDYDGDGDADILLRHNTTGQWRLFIMDVGMVTDVVAPTLYINTAWDYF